MNLHYPPLSPQDTNVTLFPENDLTRHVSVLSAILRVMDSKAYMLTHSDLLYLTETIDKATQLNKIVVSTDVFISMIGNCLELVSRLINPDMARQWEDLIAHRVCYETEMDSSKTKSSKKLLFCQVYESVSCIFLELPWTVDNGGEH